MNEDKLSVWYQNRRVGQLWQTATGGIAFQYDSDWMLTGFAISQRLPLRAAEYTAVEGVAQQFFANLLPEALLAMPRAVLTVALIPPILNFWKDTRFNF